MKFVSTGKIDNKSVLAQVMAWHSLATSHYLNQLTVPISQYWHRSWLGAVRQQAITWTNVDLDQWCHMASLSHDGLTHWGRVTHICVSKLHTIGSDNGLSPGRRQAIIRTNAGILLIRTLGTNFSDILGEIHSFSFSKMHLKMSSAKWRLFGLGLNELRDLTPKH